MKKITAILLCFVCAAGLVSASDDALVVVTEGRGQNASARSRAITQLGKKLDEKSVKSLFEMLERREDAGLTRDELLALKDEVCALLDKQEKYPSGLPGLLMAMYEDKTQDPGWRDYCIQHLGHGYNRAPIDLRYAIRELLWKATKDAEGGIAGTALIALCNNINNDPALESETVSQKALEIVAGSSSSAASKATALQICARLGNREALTHARELAQKAERPLCLSALAAIGALGDGTDREFLEKYAGNADRLISASAKTALTCLDERNKRTKGNL